MVRAGSFLLFLAGLVPLGGFLGWVVATPIDWFTSHAHASGYMPILYGAPIGAVLGLAGGLVLGFRLTVSERLRLGAVALALCAAGVLMDIVLVQLEIIRW
ncbi:MAG: hypothetical protein Q8L48_39685 [Archangium sp.]|nr:hypothetical protein [Archangium sp.]